MIPHRRKPRHERDEETEPLKVEGAHVRPRERQLRAEERPELELRRFIVLGWVDGHEADARDAILVDGVGILRRRRLGLGHLMLRVVVERPRRRYARRRRRRLQVWGLLPDSRRIAHFLLPAVVSRAEHGLTASGLI